MRIRARANEPTAARAAAAIAAHLFTAGSLGYRRFFVRCLPFRDAPSARATRILISHARVAGGRFELYRARRVLIAAVGASIVATE
jgi:hypothetical protein